ncbi:hypothetical protein VaNZ11_008556 [Volvox africanus]|uniref:Uncharacterized protein n=1 Tax=Volvox africanus TaxID=51714 RepID=A0ABQ5S6Z5_9CHLO|nr:hypothetical protein VaNZ11_008556 [Volvox africanus]
MEQATTAVAEAAAGEMVAKITGRRRRRDTNAASGDVAGKQLAAGVGGEIKALAGGRVPRKSVGGKAPARDGTGDAPKAPKSNKDRHEEEGQQVVAEASLEHKRQRRDSGAGSTPAAGPSSALELGYGGRKAELRSGGGAVGPGGTGSPVAAGPQRGRALRGRGRGRARGQGRRSTGGDHAKDMEEEADGRIVNATAAEEAGRAARWRGRGRRDQDTQGSRGRTGRGQARGHGRRSDVNPSDRVLRSRPARASNAGADGEEEQDRRAKEEENEDEDMVTAEEDAEEPEEKAEGAGRELELESDPRNVDGSAWQALMQLQSLQGPPRLDPAGVHSPRAPQSGSGTMASVLGINPADLLMAWQRHQNLVEASGKMLLHVLEVVGAMGAPKMASQGRRDSTGLGVDMGRGLGGRGRRRDEKGGGQGGTARGRGRGSRG